MACEYTDGQKRGPKEDFIKNTQKVGGESSQPNLTQIQELFESNPELANEVYSALGFVTPKKTEFTEDEAQIIVNNWKSNVVNLRGLKPSGKELNDLDNAANALLKKLLEVKGQKYTKAPTKATLVTNLFDKTKNKEVDLSKDSPISDLLNIATRFFNNDLYDDDLTSQQKQEAQGIYSQYLDSLNTTELYSKLGNKTESGNVKVVKSIFTNRDNKDVITAFRVDKKLGLLESFRKYNAIGNPINWQDFKPRFGSNLPTSDKTINIYAGSNQNAELSNFVIRPFTTNVETPSGEKQYTFQSVEQGFHFYKALIANNSQVAKQILATTNGGQLKRLTNRSNLKMTSDQVKEWDAISKSIMLNLMYDSYAQNPQAAEKLLITGDAKITHTQDNTRWKTDFPEVVMTVRDMLKEEGFDTQNQPSDNATIAFMDWFLGKDYTNLEQEYRQEILNNLDNLKGKTIEYYKELERPSHATALDYLINQLGSKQDIKGFKEFIQQPNIEQSSAKPVVTKIIDPKPRPVKNSGVVPKSKLQVVENSLTLLEEQQAINIVTDIVYELIQEELIKEGNTKSVKQIYNELFNLPDPNVNELTKQGKAGGKVQIKLRNLYQAWENKESIKSKFAQVMLRLVDVPDGKIKNNKFIRDIITGLKRKGYTVELTQSYDKDGNETWQEKVHETDHFNSISQTLKFKFNLIPKLKIVNGELVVSKGFLGATEYYSSGYVYNHLIKLLSNNPTAELFDKAIQENMNDPIINYLFNYDLGIYSDLNEFENIKTEIFRFIGQSVKWDYYDAVHAKIPNKFEPGLSTVSYVMLSNAKTLKGKIYELIVNNAKMGLLISKGDYNQTAIDNLTKKMLEVKTVEEKIALLKKYSLLPVEVDFIQQELEQDFNQIFNELHRVLTGKKQDLLNILGTKENSVLKSLGALVAKTNQVSLSVNPLHIKDSGKVFEINKPGFLAKLYQTLNKLDSVYQKYLADPLYKNSLLLDLVKQGKATYMIFNSIKLPGKKKNTYYSDSDKRSLMLQYLTMFYPAVKSEGQAFFIANPVQSDAGVQTGTRYETPLLSQEEVIKQLAEVAKRERYGIENPLQTESVVKHHLFPFLEGVAEDKFEEVIAKELIKSKREFLNHLIDLGIIETVKIEATNTTNFYFADGVFSDVSVGTLLNEFYNHYILFQAEQVLLLNGNVSFYEDATKFWKRAKQIWSPLHYLRVGAKWGNFTVRPNFNLAILSDVKKDSPLYAELKERYGDEIAKKYLKNDLADAATYIDLFRAKEIEIASRGWDQEKEDQYQRILSGDFNNKENTPYGAIKPYYFGFHSDGNRLYPFQKKDSVVTLLPYDGIETIGGKENPTFNPLHKIMLEKMGYVFSGETFTPPNEADRFNITKGLVDEFTFESAIKVGGHNINEITIVDDVASNIETDMIVVADNSNYGIQMEVPQHYLDDEQLMARQVVKNFIKGIDKTAIYTLFGQPITGENLIKKFNEVIIKKINASMDELMKRMGSFDKIVELLRTEVQKRELDEKILDALTFTDSTKTATVIPLTHPAYLYDLTGVLHSVFTNRVTKQKLMGGVSYANAASAGYKNPPKIVMENGIIQHFEAFIPISNTLFYKYVKRGEILTLEELREGLKRDGLAEQDIERLLTGLVWRTPNEGMYSNIPIKVAAFFPIERGNSIVLPSEITQIAGLDFDIDKVYGFMFGLDKTKLYNTDSIESVMRQDEDYIAKLTATYPNISVKKLINMYLAEEEWVDISNEEINTDIKEFKLIDDFIKENVSKIKINKVSLDFSMESKQGRDNLLLEIMMSFYKHPDVTAKVFKGSDFEYLKGLAKEIGKTPVSRTVIDPIAQVDTSIKYILGKALIGPFTNLNTVLALMQQHNIYTNYPLFFENELGELIEYKDISEIDNTYNILENWVAAIVDNAKFPLADALNVNWATIDVLLLGLALKVPAKQIHGLLVQPIIVEYVKEYERLGGNSEKAREAIIKKYDILNDSKIRTYKKGLNNKDIFNLFLNLSDLGQGLTRIVSASKISEEGLGPNFGTLVFRKRMYSELILDYSRPTKKPKKFENVVPYLADRSLPHYHFNQVLVKSLNFLKDELNYPNDDTGLYGATINIVEAFKKDLTNNSLTAEEINDLDRNLKTAIMSLYIDNLNPNYFSKIFKEKKKEYAQFNDPIINKFFESFVTEKYENVELTVYKGKSEELKSDMSNFRTFIDLIIDADPEFAKLLGENTFKIDGFNIAPHGYTHLLSSKWYKTFTPELIVNNIFSSDSDLFRGMSDIFIDQYFRNNFRKITFLPIIKDLTVYKGVYGKDTNNLYRWDPTISSYKKIEALGIYSNDKNKPMGKLTYEYDLGSVNLNPSQTNVEIIKDDTDGNVDDYLETMEEPKGLTKSDVDQTQGETDGTIECGKTE